ncbi:MAG: D-alanyl-D-alanine carboxypeptidase [Firmicutes bacterium]|nr:D-alanyl-D-alanine carboxypeptidase [Bacillota bacterium]
MKHWCVAFVLVLGAALGTAALLSGGWVRLSPPQAVISREVLLRRHAVHWQSTAQSAILAVAHGPVLYSREAQVRRPIASVTKMMTAYLVLTHPRLYPENRRITITAPEVLNDRQGLLKGDSEVPLQVGERVTVGNLLLALMLPSADDAAWVLARSYPGGAPAFIRQMNRTAAELGMRETHYVDPDGVNHLGYSTARDLLTLINRDMALRRFRQLVRTKRAHTPWGWLTNLNQLLWQYPGAIGIKTGWTPYAGSCLAYAAVRYHGGQRLVLEGVVLDEPSFGVMFRDVAGLLNEGFRALRYQVVFPRGATVAVVRVRGGWWRRPQPAVKLVLGQPVGAYPVATRARVQVRWVVRHWTRLSRGEVVGYLRLRLGTTETPWVPVKAQRGAQNRWL